MARWTAKSALPVLQATLAISFAGYIAREMGLPIAIWSSPQTQNDLLAPLPDTGGYHKGEVHASDQPSMDIQVRLQLLERALYFCLWAGQ